MFRSKWSTMAWTFEIFRPGPLTADEQRHLAGRGATGPYVLFVGQIYPYKKLDVLADAFCRAIAGAGLPHRLVVVGSFGRADAMGDGLSAARSRAAIMERPRDCR